EVLADEKPDLILLKEMLQTINDTSSRIGKIVQGMRKFSRDGGLDIKTSEKIENIVQETLVLCREAIKARSIELQSDSISKDIEVECRAVEISQVLLNLLNNAIAAIENLPTRWIRFSVRDLGDDVELSVTDSGIIQNPEIRNKLFTPFFTTKPVGKGTGLGLAISKKIIENHRGTLSIDLASTNTRFIIKLPKRS
ncbi:MAG: ATP-binding protein, partial [Bdellovibrionota bacterium]